MISVKCWIHGRPCPLCPCVTLQPANCLQTFKLLRIVDCKSCTTFGYSDELWRSWRGTRAASTSSVRIISLQCDVVGNNWINWSEVTSVQRSQSARTQDTYINVGNKLAVNRCRPESYPSESCSISLHAVCVVLFRHKFSSSTATNCMQAITSNYSPFRLQSKECQLLVQAHN